MPVVTGAAFGPVGVVGALANIASDMAIQSATKGEKQTFGDLFVDPKEHPYWNLAANMLNPVNFIGAYDAAPVARTINELGSAAKGTLKQTVSIAEKIPTLTERRLFNAAKPQALSAGVTGPEYMFVPKVKGNTVTLKQVKYDPQHGRAIEVGDEVISISKNMKQEKAADLINMLTDAAKEQISPDGPIKPASRGS